MRWEHRASLLVRQLHRGGWTALSGVLVTRQGTDDLGLGAGDVTVGLVASPV